MTRKGTTKMRFMFVVLLMLTQSCVCTVVDPGNRGVQVEFGEVKPRILPEGLSQKALFASVTEISVRQQIAKLDATCFSSDLQQVQIHAKVMYRVPENNVIKVFRDYRGDPFDSLVSPRIQESIKEVTALLTAEQLAKQREDVKLKTLDLSRQKVGEIIEIVDIVIENVDLSPQLKLAIESKMVQEQEAAKAKFTQQKAEIEAATDVIRAEGEAKAIRIRGQALRETPGLIELQIVEKWNGVSPMVVGSGTGANILLPMTGGK
jgi:prohibitin 2